MGEVVLADVLEQIVIRLDVRDLLPLQERERYCGLVGSSNGLVCIISNLVSCKVLVGNPLTREVRQLPLPPWMIHSKPLCGGFGYDSSRDDYKFFVGAEKHKKRKHRTWVQVLSLKSNVWRVIGEVKYTFLTGAGILCNGAFHWVARDEKKKILIIAYDLSKEEFKEIPLPKEEWLLKFSRSLLGIVNGCLCILGSYACEYDLWIMKKYNVKQSWELLMRNHELKPNILHYLTLPKDESFFHYGAESWFPRGTHYLLFIFDAPTFVESLVSPQPQPQQEMCQNSRIKQLYYESLNQVQEHNTSVITDL
ncbi:putative galactose oxidase/kelch, beta-propeller, F-box associated interaction [Helianthus anomalus]